MTEELTTDGRIRRVIGRMPYGGLLPRSPVSAPDVPYTTEQLADYLESLADRLAEVAQRDSENERALTSMRCDLAAVTRVFQLVTGERSL